MRALPWLLLALLLLPALAAGQEEPEATPAERALEWLASLPSWSMPTNVVEAVSAMGEDPKRWPGDGRDIHSLLKPGRGIGGPYYTDLRIAHAVGSSGYDPRDVNGVDFVARVRAGFSNGQSGSATYVNDDIWAILALRAAGVPPDDEQVVASARVVRAAQLPDGGWSHSVGALKGSTDVTGAALAALAAAGDDMSAHAAARAFLDATYDAETGGHHTNQGIGTNCQSTVWALHGYASLGVAERADSLAYLRRLQNPDGGLRISDGPSDDFCTAEALVILAGERYPLPSYRAVAPPAPRGHAREPLALPLPEGYTSGVWTFDDLTLRGQALARAFPARGEHAYSLLAEAPGVRARTEGVVVVESARPRLGSLPGELALARHAPLVLDLRNASDPDGQVVRILVDWGDGSLSDTRARLAEHSYATPGERVITIRAVDDAGVESHPARLLARVENRAPEIAPLPERLVADRATGIDLAANATDPDGDEVALSWRYGELRGEGAPRFTPAALGNGTLLVQARDPWGGETEATIAIEVLNLPPALSVALPARVVEGERVELRAEATDADGPAPLVEWRVGDETLEGAVVRVRAAPGAMAVRATARDADGATVVVERTLVAEGDGTPAAPPEIASLAADLVDGALVVRFDAPSDARATLSWTSDAGEGAREGASSPARVPLPGATWAIARLVVERDGLVASAETPLLVAPQSPPPARATQAPPATSPVVVRSDAAPPEALPEEEAPLQPAGVRLEASSRRTPAPAALASLALLAGLALLGAPRRRAR